MLILPELRRRLRKGVMMSLWRRSRKTKIIIQKEMLRKPRQSKLMLLYVFYYFKDSRNSQLISQYKGH